MDSPNRNENESQHDPALRQWIVAAVLIVLMLGCVGLLAANAGSGIEINGEPVHYRLVSTVTQSPFCPPEDPRLSSLLFERKRWIVCLIREPQTPASRGRSMQKLIDLQLWK